MISFIKFVLGMPSYRVITSDHYVSIYMTRAEAEDFARNELLSGRFSTIVGG